jgi:hypothetical protein
MVSVKPISFDWFVGQKKASQIARIDNLVEVINRAISDAGLNPYGDFSVVFEDSICLDIGLRLAKAYESVGWRVKIESTNDMTLKLTLS